MTNAFSWQNSISLCPASFCIPRPNLPVTPGVSWLPTFAFQCPIMKRTSFFGVSSKRFCGGCSCDRRTKRGGGGCDRGLSVAERSYPTSEVRGRSQEDPMPEWRQPRGDAPRPRSGAAAESARLRRPRDGQEELPKSKVRGDWPRGATPHPRSGAAVERRYPANKVRDSGQEELPQAPMPEAGSGSREELSYAWGQGRWPGGPTPRLRPGAAAGGPTPCPRSSGCTGAGGPRGAIPRWRSGRAVVRRYPSSKVRSSCAFLQQPWRDTPCPR